MCGSIQMETDDLKILYGAVWHVDTCQMKAISIFSHLHEQDVVVEVGAAVAVAVVVAAAAAAAAAFIRLWVQGQGVVQGFSPLDHESFLE